jgi:ribosomal 50S subunit-recycling heat shock protein
MRVDQFLNTVNIVKSRSIAKDMVDNKVIFINDKVAKGSKEVKLEDIIKIQYLEDVKKYKIIQVPTAKTTKKSEQDKYIQEL